MLIKVPISLGEIIDKITILEIKNERLTDSEKKKNVNHEMRLLNQYLSATLSQKEVKTLTPLKTSLKEINLKLWDIEDNIRACEREKEFSSAFIGLARNVYITNDQRALLKKQINIAFGSELIEEKSYQDY